MGYRFGSRIASAAVDATSVKPQNTIEMARKTVSSADGKGNCMQKDPR